MEVKNKELSVELPDKKKSIFIDFFWIGFAIYSVSYVVSTTGAVNWRICNVIQLLGLMIFMPSVLFFIRLRISNIYLRILFLVYLLWYSGVIIRGIKIDFLSIKNMIFDANLGILPYFIPFVLLFPTDSESIKKIFNTIVIFGIIYIILVAIFIRQLLVPYENTTSQGLVENFSQFLSLPCGYLLLMSVYHSKPRKLFVLFVMGLTFILAVMRARRGLMFMSLSILAFSFLIYQYANKTKVINIILSFFLITSVSYAAYRIYDKNKQGAFNYVTHRIVLNTRTEVEQYFYQDLKTPDWIAGKGMFGEYFCPGVVEGPGQITIFRDVIETGFLQVILKSGLIGLSLFLFLAVPAIIKGLFNSKNILCKASAIWIFLFILFLYPGRLNLFSLHYALVWISIGFCFSKQIRLMTDNQISSILKKKTLSDSKSNLSDAY